MKKIYINLFLVFALVVSFTNTAHATGLNLTTSVFEPVSCNATDTDGVVHNYPDNGSHLAICALEAALSNGSVSSVGLSNQYPSMGLFVTSINGVAADPNSQYWALYQNGSYAASGLASLPVAVGDVIILQFHDFSYNNIGDQLTINIRSLVSNVTSVSSTSSASSASGGGQYTPWLVEKTKFDV